ncbi:MAG: voltage-gated potassium channel, partial [Pseudonocardiales bacterium]|nr:voltage-gated potassium channel [Pseudonocardiales bacterium]
MDPSLVGPIRMPDTAATPIVSLLRRIAIAVGALVATALIVYFGRDGYIDNNSDTPISLGDAFYYSTVSVSTTG